METILYYNFWGSAQEMQKVLTAAKEKQRQMIPLTFDEESVLNPANNKTRCKHEIISFVGNDLWGSYLKPKWIDYLTRARAAAPIDSTKQYMLDCSNDWCNTTMGLLKDLKSDLEAPDRRKLHTSLLDEIDTALLRIQAENLLYSKPVEVKQQTGEMLEPAATTRGYLFEDLPAVAKQICKTAIDAGLFEETAQGQYKWLPMSPTRPGRYELVQFILILNNLVSGNTDNIYNYATAINWKQYGFIIYQGKPVNEHKLTNEKTRIVTGNVKTDLTTTRVYQFFEQHKEDLVTPLK
jgi:hypothetical protein